MKDSETIWPVEGAMQDRACSRMPAQPPGMTGLRYTALSGTGCAYRNRMKRVTSAVDRRQAERGTQYGEPPRRILVESILGSYREMPGLCLRLEQAAKLFGLPPRTCEVVLEDLVREGQLRRAADGQYLRV